MKAESVINRVRLLPKRKLNRRKCCVMQMKKERLYAVEIRKIAGMEFIVGKSFAAKGALMKVVMTRGKISEDNVQPNFQLLLMHA